MNLQITTSENILPLSGAGITPAQRARIGEIHADFVAKMEKWNLELAEKRKKYGRPESQLIPVADEVLFAIIQPSEMWCLEIDWRIILYKMTGDERFLTISNEQVEAYAVRAGILLQLYLNESAGGNKGGTSVTEELK